VIGCGGEVIARHPRCYDREDMVFDAVHYRAAGRRQPDRALPCGGLVGDGLVSFINGATRSRSSPRLRNHLHPWRRPDLDGMP